LNFLSASLLGLLWLLVISWVILRINKRFSRPLPASWLLIAFVSKVVAGISYGYLMQKMYPNNDTWIYFSESLREYQTLIHDPLSFFRSAMPSIDHFTVPDFFSSEGANWKNAGDRLVIKLLALCNLFSAGNYYVDVTLFNIFSFAGLYLIWQVTGRILRGNPLFQFLVLFFFPGFLFWGSGIHKDGLIICCIGLIIYAIRKLMVLGPAWKWRLVGLMAFFVLFLLRNAVIILLLPAILAWWLAERKKEKSFQIFCIVFASTLILFFLSAWLPDKFNLPLRMAQRQHAFLQLSGNSELPLKTLQPNAGSYISVFPRALNHSFLRPYPTELKNPLYWFAFMEMVVLFVIVFLYFASKPKNWKKLIDEPYSLFLLFFSISSCILIGYIVPFTGAIVRYKAMYEILLLLPLVTGLRFRKLSAAEHNDGKG
jgi:hypothetical protein